jgi:hypothetical protein
MTATPDCPKGRHKSNRILLLLLLVILLLLLTAYATLPHEPAHDVLPPLAPVTGTPAEPTATPAEPTATPAEPTATPAEPTATPEEPTATPEEPTATPEEPTATATEEGQGVEAPNDSVTPTQSPAASGEMDDGGGDMAALDEVAGPAILAPAPTETLAAVTPTMIPTEAPVIARPVTPTPVAVTPVAEAPITVADVVLNSDFAQGFQSDGVAVGWSSFNNGGAEFSYFSDTWPAVVGETGPSQVMRVRNAGLPDRYLGIYQTVSVVPGQAYSLSMSGLVRTNSGDVNYSKYGYRLQLGIDTQGGSSWEAVKGWIELPWDEQLRAQDAHGISTYTTTVIARSDKLTIFVRAWKKWADAGEGAYDVTNVSLLGPDGFGTQMPATTPATPAMPVTGGGERPWGDSLRVIITSLLVVVLVTGAIWRTRRQRQA